MFLLRLLILLFFSLNIFASDEYIDSLTLTKVKKLVEKEEEIATAYKKYILEKGTETTDITTLKTSVTLKTLLTYLPSNFDTNNYFGGTISFSTNTHKLRSFTTADNTLKSNIYDYYYSNKYRTNTKAPMSINNSDVEIILSPKEKLIYTNKNKITTIKTTAEGTAAGKYYLDPNGVLHWYQSGSYKFSVDKDLIVDSSVTMLKDKTTVDTAFKDMIKDVTYAGQTIIQKNSNSADAYTGINENTIVRQNPDIILDTQVYLMQIGKKSGGMIVNGDIYTWGNNINRITGINQDTYTNSSGTNGSYKPVINTLVKVKAKIYEKYVQQTDNSTNRASCKSPIGSGTVSCKYSTTDCINPTGSGTILCKDIGYTFYEQNYFSSPLRPRFVDLFSNTKNGTCGITTNGELYCGGTTGPNYAFGNNFTHVDTTRNGEMLYRSTYFDGTTKKASKIFANNQLWLILSKDGDIYRWGTEDRNGFSGNSSSSYNSQICTSSTTRKCSGSIILGLCFGYWYDDTTTSCTGQLNTNLAPEIITENISGIKFKDITNTLSSGYRKMFALSTTGKDATGKDIPGDIYIWGKDSSIADMNNTTCMVTWEGVSFDLCKATKITTTNSNLPSGLTFESIRSGLHAIIALGSNGKYYKIEQPINKKVQITELKYGTDTLLKTTALSVDLTNTGVVVYVNTSNQLISDYFTSFDTTFKNTINSMSWKSIKVLEEGNGMCGINTDNQMYCWGVQTYRSPSNAEENTFMLPVFNTNLYDSTTDYLVSEGGTSNILTKMTSGVWLDSNNNFYIKYPTYIGGFNYEFIFK